MAVIRQQQFGGANLALQPRLLPLAVGVSSLNQWPVRGDLRPIKAPLNVASVPAGRSTIYRMGRDTISDTQYWLSWAGQVHAVRGFIASDTTERTYYTGDGVPKWTDNIKALAASPYPNAWRQLGVPAPASAPSVSAAGGASTNNTTVFVVFTYVTDADEESAPSPPSAQVDCKDDATLTINGFGTLPAGSFGINRIRIYQTQAGSSTTDFFFQQEIAATATSAPWALSGNLGEVMPSTTWLAPPADLHHLTGMWNGMMAGITGRSVRVCEAYVPYAWPAAYEIVAPDVSPVALVTWGEQLLVLTNGRPLLVTGSTPDALSAPPVEFSQACVSDKSAVEVGDGVVWASADGLAYYGARGAQLLTNGIATRDDWQALNPATMVGFFHQGMYCAFYQDAGSVWRGLMIDPGNPTGLFFLDFGFASVFRDPYSQQVYGLASDGTIQKFNAGSAKVSSFKTKVFRQQAPITGFARGEFVGTGQATISLYADGVLKATVTANPAETFNLPGGYYANEFQMEFSTSGDIQGVVMAHSIEELAEQ